MKLHFHKISIEGFLSIGSAELDLADRGYVLIKGENNCPDDGAHSNGCGKTACLEALVWCLTGETIRGISKNISNIHTDTGAKVELDFTADGKDYKLIRSKDHKKLGTNLRIFIDGEDKSGKGIRDGEKLLSEYLPELTNSLINSVVVLGQGLPQRFTSNTPAGRKEVLEQLSKSDFMIEDIKRRLADRKSILATDIREAEDAILKASSKISAYQGQIATHRDQLAALADPAVLLATIQEGELKVDRLQVDLAELYQQRSALEEQYSALIDSQSNLTYEQDKAVQATRSKYEDQLRDQQSQAAQLQASIKSLKVEIRKLKSVTDVCPTCGQKLPDVHKVDTAEQEKQLEESRGILAQLNQSIQSLTIQASAEAEQVRSQFKQQLLETANCINNLRSGQSSLNRKIGSYESERQAQLSVVATAKAKYESLETTKQALQQNINLAEAEVEKLQEDIVYNTSGRDALKAQAEVVAKMTTIASRDFRGILLTNVIEYINRRIKIYSAEIFNSEKALMTLDGNALNISYDGKLYENLSGGERRKVDIIVSFAIRDMLSQFSSFSSNILCLDEITDGVDDMGVRSIFNCISSKMQNLESVFIITHKSDVAAIPVDSIITVVKNECGVSSIENGL